MLAKRYERKYEPDNGQAHPSRRGTLSRRTEGFSERGILRRAQSQPPPRARAPDQSRTPKTAPKPVVARPRAPELPP